MTATKYRTDRQTLLAAVRKGDFRALLALVDLWTEEGDERQARAWADAIRGPSCSVTADSNILAGVLGPIPGEAPVWFASGSGGVWHREQPEKSILALAPYGFGSPPC